MRIPLILAVLAGVLGLAVAAEAGRYHQGAGLACADCHIMHARQSHDVAGGVTAININAGAGVAMLLRNAGGANALCLACHDGQTTAPDVLGIDINSAANASVGGRSAGALNNSGNTGSPYQDWKGHSLNFSGDAPYTGGAAAFNTAGLKCTNCHDQHGNTNYRNLRSKADGGSALGTTNISDLVSTTLTENTANLRINTSAPYAPPAGGNPAAATRAPYYGTNNIFHHEPAANLDAYTNYCVNCHAGFTTGNKHPALTGANVTALPANNFFVANWATLAKVKVTATDYTPNTGPTGASPVCATCHKAHGNDNPFGLMYMLRTDVIGAVNEQGSTGGSTETQLCSQCHTQAN